MSAFSIRLRPAVAILLIVAYGALMGAEAVHRHPGTVRGHASLDEGASHEAHRDLPEAHPCVLCAGAPAAVEPPAAERVPSPAPVGAVARAAAGTLHFFSPSTGASRAPPSLA